MEDTIKIVCTNENNTKEFVCRREILLESPHFEKIRYCDNIINISVDIGALEKYLFILECRFLSKRYPSIKINYKLTYTEQDLELYDYLIETELFNCAKYDFDVALKYKISEIVQSNKYEDLLSLPYIIVDELCIQDICQICKLNDELLINIIDLVCKSDSDITKFILGICRYSTPSIIKYIINKNVDLECVDYDGMRPIHYICRYSTPEMIKYIIDRRVNLECVDCNGMRPFHYICKYSTYESIKYIIDSCVIIECVDLRDKLPLEYIEDPFCRKKILDYIRSIGIKLKYAY